MNEELGIVIFFVKWKWKDENKTKKKTTISTTTNGFLKKSKRVDYNIYVKMMIPMLNMRKM